jgi:hypothetical protein
MIPDNSLSISLHASILSICINTKLNAWDGRVEGMDLTIEAMKRQQLPPFVNAAKKKRTRKSRGKKSSKSSSTQGAEGGGGAGVGVEEEEGGEEEGDELGGDSLADSSSQGLNGEFEASASHEDVIAEDTVEVEPGYSDVVEDIVFVQGEEEGEDNEEEGEDNKVNLNENGDEDKSEHDDDEEEVKITFGFYEDDEPSPVKKTKAKASLPPMGNFQSPTKKSRPY